jgi:hypothetical protein
MVFPALLPITGAAVWGATLAASAVKEQLMRGWRNIGFMARIAGRTGPRGIGPAST